MSIGLILFATHGWREHSETRRGAQPIGKSAELRPVAQLRSRPRKKFAFCS